MTVIAIIFSSIAIVISAFAIFYSLKAKSAIMKIIAPKLDEHDKNFENLLVKLKKIL